MHILLLGGTSEASALAHRLAHIPGMRATLSLAGRTQNPVLPEIDYRIGGFGGAQGLAEWIKNNHVTALVDATHPFARIMPFNAAQAASATHIPLLSLQRPPWIATQSDHWLEVDSHTEAITALGESPRRIFLTVGRLEIDAYAQAPQHFYAVRTIDPVQPKPLPHAIWITDRGPFNLENEQMLLTTHKLYTVITKNSGGSATAAKLTAARNLGLSVILLRRPAKPDVERVATAEQAMQWIASVHKLSL